MRPTFNVLRLAATTAVAAVTMATAARASTITLNFDSVAIGPTQAPGVWYTDRYAPAGFQTAFFDGDNRLKHSISAADGGNSRPPAFASGFYNTQGRMYDLPAGILYHAIDLYVPADWATTGRRMAGLWGVARDTGDAIARYPILEFTSDSGTPRFRGWNNGTWLDLGLPTGFTYDAWYTLEVTLNLNGSFTYVVGDVSATTAASASAYIGQVILQGHNTDEGVTYDIYWDNYRGGSGAEPIPLPSAAIAGLALLGGLGLTRNRR